MADMNVIDIIELDCSSPAMEDSMHDMNDGSVEAIMHSSTNGSVKESDLNDESMDNQENEDLNIGAIDENEEELNEEEDEEPEEEDILISDDEDGNSQSTAASVTKFNDNGVSIDLIKSSCEATPNDSDNSNSIVSSTQTSLKSKVENSSKLKDSVQNGKEDIVSADEPSNVNSVAKQLQSLDIAPDISAEETGFPTYMTSRVIVGKRIAINKKTWNDIDIDGNDSILDCPSQVVPLMIQRPNAFPEKLKESTDETQQKSETNTSGVSQNSKNMLTIADFYASSVGKFLVGLGLSRAKQWYHKDAIGKVKKQMRREGEVDDLVDELRAQQEYYAECRAANSSYVFPTEKCAHCDFRTEFKLVLKGHLSYPHLTPRREYKCNYCQFATRDPKQIVLHTQALHEQKCLIEIPPQLYECPVCPYESGVKSKAATHITKCLKFFNADKLLNLTDELDFPTITPKPITQEDIKIYEATLQALRFAALNPQTKVPHIPGLPSGLQHQMLLVQQQQLGVRVGPGRPPKQAISLHQKSIRPIAPLAPNPYGSKNVAPQLYQMLSTAAGHTQLVPIQNKNTSNSSQMMNKMSPFSSANMIMKNSNTSNKPNILSKSNNSPISMRPTNDNMTGKSGTFVICEICDGYIKDLEQLRTHMQWIHKVKIHPKMLASRPPLNCQKCQWRFFTDQGLERHLLGAHGLVTSNMQDMVNQNQDGGRCTICGRVFANKLVAHMNQVHKINLKPAHLSYKCTVCSATFNLYRLFENHVYMVHSGSVKRNSEDASGQPPKKKAALEITTNNGEKKSSINHTVVSGNKVVLSSNLPARVSQ